MRPMHDVVREIASLVPRAEGPCRFDMRLLRAQKARRPEQGLLLGEVSKPEDLRLGYRS
jgi:hypothetical protein